MPLFPRRQKSVALVATGNPTRVSVRHDALREELQTVSNELVRYNGAATPQSLTAAGELIQRGQATYLRRLIQAPQIRALGYYEIVGELKYAAGFYARALSQLEIFAGEIDENGDIVPTKNEVVKQAVARIRDPGGVGRSGMLENYGRLMFLTGESYLFVTINARTKVEQWEILSTDEVRLLDGLYTRFKAPQLIATQFQPAPDGVFEPVGYAPGTDGPEPIKDENGDVRQAVAYRIWKRNPRFSGLADSTVMGALDILEELVLLTQAVRARARSRLAGSGILFIDDRITTRPQEATPDEDAQEDIFLADLTEAMTKPILNEGTAGAVVPLIARVKVPEGMKLSDLVYHLQIIDPLQVYPETGLRMECIRRLAISLDMPPEVLLGTSDVNHWPCDEATQVFTADRGFVSHDELASGDVVLSLNHDTGTSEWVPLSGVRREYVTDREMVRVLTPSLDALTTPDHKWPILRGGERVWTDSEHLGPFDRVIRAAPHAGLPDESPYEDDFVRLVGWYVSEGTCTWPAPKHCQVRIGQSHIANPDKVVALRELLTRLYGPAKESLVRRGATKGSDVAPAWREVAEPRGMTLFHLNKTAYTPLLDVMESWHSKVIDKEFIYSLTQQQLLLLLESVASGDGRISQQGGLSIDQRDPRRLAPLLLAAVLAGRPVMVSTQERTGGFSDGTHYALRIPITRGYDTPVGETDREAYTGVIFCPQVPPTASFLARRNGKVYFTGNSAWSIDEQTWKYHLQPIANAFVQDLTSAYLTPYLISVNMPDWEKYLIGYDAAKVINHPDRSKDAKDAFDRGELGGEGLRRILNLDENDAPTEEERQWFRALKLHDASYGVYGIPSLRSNSELEPTAGEIVTPDGPQGTSGGVTAEEVDKAPPEKPASPEQQDENVVGSVMEQATAAMIQGAAQVGLLRAREAAGARVRTLARRDKELEALIDGVRGGDVLATIGRARARQIPNIPPDVDLISGARDLILDSLRCFGVDRPEIAVTLCDTIERHAVRTLYDERPAPMPDSFSQYVTGILRASRNGNG